MNLTRAIAQCAAACAGLIFTATAYCADIPTELTVIPRGSAGSAPNPRGHIEYRVRLSTAFPSDAAVVIGYGEIFDDLDKIRAPIVLSSEDQAALLDAVSKADPTWWKPGLQGMAMPGAGTCSLSVASNGRILVLPCFDWQTADDSVDQRRKLFTRIENVVLTPEWTAKNPELAGDLKPFFENAGLPQK